jgi:hypothetical protein
MIFLFFAEKTRRRFIMKKAGKRNATHLQKQKIPSEKIRGDNISQSSKL